MVIQTPQKDEDATYQALINENLQLIEKQCFKAVQLQYEKASMPKLPHLTLENEALELSNHILDKLREKNYRILKQFKGKSKLSTYLSVIIANQIVDTIRKKRGRTREKERAKPYGLLGSQIIQRIVVEGCPPDHLYEELKSQDNFNYTEEEFAAIVDRIRGSRSKVTHANPSENNLFLQRGIQDPESGELIVVDSKNNPEKKIIRSQKQEKLKEVLDLIVSQLNGEERLILRLRFSIQRDESPKDINSIARLLGVSKKAAYKKISRTLKKCRRILIQRGLKINDLF
jgi:RNA polymerase sigma factor (sigma-70 family)